MSKQLSKTAGAIFFAAAAAMAQNATFPATENPRVALTAVPNTSYAIMGLDFLSDGRMVMLTASIQTSGQSMGQGAITPADGNQALYLVSGLSRSGSLAGATLTKILDQMTGPPPGVKVVNDTIYVVDRTAFYRVNSLSPSSGTSKANNATRIINIPTLDSNFTWNRGESGHQYFFTPQYYNGRFYTPYSGSIITGGTSNAPPTNTLTGAILSWDKNVIIPTGAPANFGYVKEAGGMRSPNGMNVDGAGNMLIADNQGSFLPANPFYFFKPGQPQQTYGHRQSTSTNAGGATGITNTLRNWAEDLPYKPPVIWVPYQPLRSASQPLYLDRGPYRGDWIVGDVNAPGLGRLHLDNVDNSGNYQASFHFLTNGVNNSGGTSSGKAINRMAWSPDSAIYVGTMLNIGNWPTGTAGPVTRMTFRDTAVFEILAVRSRMNPAGNANGVEIFFSQPVNPATATSGNFALLQLNYMRSANYGCNSLNCTQQTPQVTSVSLSSDRRKAFIGIATPDTSIGAAYIGTLGVGNNPRGVWGGPGKQDRTLRVTISNVTSSTGASLFYNIAWMGWHFQSATRFDSANVDLTPSFIQGRKSEAARLATSLAVRSLAGTLNVSIGLPGRATVSLYGLNGALKSEKTGSSGTFSLDTRSFGRGLHVLRVRHGVEVYSRTVLF